MRWCDRQSILSLVFAVALGVATTVAVAFVAARSANPLLHGEIGSLDGVRWVRHSAFGRDVTLGQRVDPEHRWNNIDVCQAISLADGLRLAPMDPAVRRHVRWSAEPDGVQLWRAGWPLRAFIGWISEPAAAQSRVRWLWRRTGQAPMGGQYLPLMPVPFGFAANSVAAAAGWLVLIAVARRLRTALMRCMRRCSRCGYHEYSGVSGCPECGAGRGTE